MQLNWFEVENSVGKKSPRWQRSVAITSDGTVFIPSAIAGNEHEVFLCTLSDGTPSLNYLNHIYVPTSWLAQEFPDTKETCEVIELNIRKFSESGLPM